MSSIQTAVWALILMTAIAFLLLVGSVVIPEARAQEALHDPKNPAHWYPATCCSQRDCEPLERDAVTENADGSWDVNYVSARFGLINEHIPFKSARDSQDGGFHGCWRLNPNEKPRTICFFRPLNT